MAVTASNDSLAPVDCTRVLSVYCILPRIKRERVQLWTAKRESSSSANFSEIQLFRIVCRGGAGCLLLRSGQQLVVCSKGPWPLRGGLQ